MHRFLRFRYSSKLCKKGGNFDTSKLVANFKTTFGCITINIDDKSEIPEQGICIVYSFFFGGGGGAEWREAMYRQAIWQQLSAHKRDFWPCSLLTIHKCPTLYWYIWTENVASPTTPSLLMAWHWWEHYVKHFPWLQQCLRWSVDSSYSLILLIQHDGYY